MARLRDPAELQRFLGYNFRDPKLLLEALTHSSYAHERPQAAAQDNERLEFLGDAVLGLAAARYLVQTLPMAEEGELSRMRAVLVREEWLAAAARMISLGDFLRLGRGEDRSGGRRKSSILSGATEALIGAVFRDGGWRSAYRVSLKFFREPLLAEEVLRQAADAKTHLQELCQERFHLTPSYRLVSQAGPSHHPRFRVEALLGKKVLAEGEGLNKKEAEQAAAAAALESLGSLQGKERKKGKGAFGSLRSVLRNNE